MRTAMIVLLFLFVAGYTAAFATTRTSTPAWPGSPARPFGPVMSPGAVEFLLDVR
jgi:hypothetical protein